MTEFLLHFHTLFCLAVTTTHSSPPYPHPLMPCYILKYPFPPSCLTKPSTVYVREDDIYQPVSVIPVVKMANLKHFITESVGKVLSSLVLVSLRGGKIDPFSPSIIPMKQSE